MTKLCLYCKNWYMDHEDDYSDVTLGNGFTTGCHEYKWYMSEGELNEDEYRKNMELAQQCDLYKEVKL